MKIIRQQRGKDGSCTRIKTMTKSFPEEAKKDIENFSCENDGLTSDAGCWKQVDGQYLYKGEECPKPSLEQPDVTFSKSVFDPETNLVFVYKFWYCGDFCARESFLVYELKGNGKLEYKYGFMLRVS